jgi:uncharacterized protein YfdQ (DUF2303 family)
MATPDQHTHVHTRTENDTIAEVTKKLSEVAALDLAKHEGKTLVLSVPDGRKIVSIKPFLDEYLTEPERRKGTAEFTDLASFIEHVKRFADSDSVVFANDDPDDSSLTAVLDYHRKGATGSPRFGEHRSTYSFPLSDEWKAWTQQGGKKMSQLEFAEFIENRLVDVSDAITPEPDTKSTAHDWAKRMGVDFGSPSRILELSKGLSAKQTNIVRGAQDLASGETEIFFATSAEDPAGVPLKIPRGFLLPLPVFKGGDLYFVPARLRYRIDGRVTWWFDLARTEAVFEDAFSEACKEVTSCTSCPVLRGTPEGDEGEE